MRQFAASAPRKKADVVGAKEPQDLAVELIKDWLAAPRLLLLLLRCRGLLIGKGRDRFKIDRSLLHSFLFSRVPHELVYSCDTLRELITYKVVFTGTI